MRQFIVIKLLYTLVLIVFLLSPYSLWAQYDPGTFRIGGQFGFWTEIESFGLGVRTDYALTSKFILAPDFMYYFGDDDFGIEVNWYDINLNMNYMIEINNSSMVPYVLGGLNLARVAVKCDGSLGSICDDFSNTEMGFNLGGGVDFLLAGSLALFGELRVVLSGENQMVLAVGVKLPVN
jgi:opacity protein-like surface antigen